MKFCGQRFSRIQKFVKIMFFKIPNLQFFALMINTGYIFSFCHKWVLVVSYLGFNVQKSKASKADEIKGVYNTVKLVLYLFHCTITQKFRRKHTSALFYYTEENRGERRLAFHSLSLLTYIILMTKYDNYKATFMLLPIVNYQNLIFFVAMQ